MDQNYVNGDWIGVLTLLRPLKRWIARVNWSVASVSTLIVRVSILLLLLRSWRGESNTLLRLARYLKESRSACLLEVR